MSIANAEGPSQFLGIWAWTLYTFVQFSKLQLGIPCSAIGRFQRSLAAIPEKRAQLEPLFATADRVHRALMSKIYILADSKALRIFIRENCRTGRFGLAHSIGCPGIIQEDVVDAAGVPGIHTVGASEARVAD